VELHRYWGSVSEGSNRTEVSLANEIASKLACPQPYAIKGAASGASATANLLFDHHPRSTQAEIYDEAAGRHAFGKYVSGDENDCRCAEATIGTTRVGTDLDGTALVFASNAYREVSSTLGLL